MAERIGRERSYRDKFMGNIMTTVGAEKNVRMTHSQFARQPIASVFASWSVLRVCLRVKIADTGADITAPPNFAFGLCAGSTNIIGDPTTDHFVGAGYNPSFQSQWPRSTTTSTSYAANFAVGKRVGTTYSEGAYLQNPTYLHTTRYKLLFLNITKGSPTYMGFQLFSPNSVLDSDATSADFLAQAVAGTPTLAGHGWGSYRTFSVDESVDGSLTHVCAWWDQIGSSIDVAELQVFKVA
jgi:hypothetical protein